MANKEYIERLQMVITHLHKAGKDDSDERFVAVLEIPPVVSSETAVKVAIAAEVKGKK